MSVSMKPFDVQVHEINVKINTFKIGDGLIFGYVPRRKQKSKISKMLLMYASDDHESRCV